MESSSNAPAVVDNAGDAAVPSESGAASAGGQYDNRSHGGGGGGIMSHLTYEVGGGFNAPTS